MLGGNEGSGKARSLPGFPRYNLPQLWKCCPRNDLKGIAMTITWEPQEHIWTPQSYYKPKASANSRSTHGTLVATNKNLEASSFAVSNLEMLCKAGGRSRFCPKQKFNRFGSCWQMTAEILASAIMTKLRSILHLPFRPRWPMDTGITEKGRPTVPTQSCKSKWKNVFNRNESLADKDFNARTSRSEAEIASKKRGGPTFRTPSCSATTRG